MARPRAKPSAPDVGMPSPTVPAVERRPPSPSRAAEETMEGAEGVSMELSVDDYLVGSPCLTPRRGWLLLVSIFLMRFAFLT
jgi:hypothetical protein